MTGTNIMSKPYLPHDAKSLLNKAEFALKKCVEWMELLAHQPRARSDKRYFDGLRQTIEVYLTTHKDIKEGTTSSEPLHEFIIGSSCPTCGRQQYKTPDGTLLCTRGHMVTTPAAKNKGRRAKPRTVDTSTSQVEE